MKNEAEKQCVDCGSLFKTSYSSIRCIDCREKKRISLLKYKGKVFNHICRQCRTSFQWNTPTKIYCSQSCADDYNKIKAKQKTANSTFSLRRFDIFKRDNFQCVYCGQSSIEDGVKLNVDHVYPKEKGGSNDAYNIVTACRVCNLVKGGTVFPVDIMMRLWERNENLNRKVNISFEEMKEVFDNHYKVVKQISEN